MTAPAVKICGLTRVEDAQVAVDAGADYLGAILSPGFARSVPAEVAASFVAPGWPPLVAVLVDATVAEAVRIAGAGRASVIQLHGEESPDYLRTLREKGDWAVWKAVRVRSEDDLLGALDRFGAVADGLLVDGWHEARGGGVGAAFPWAVVAAVRPSFPPGLTFIAAGGLKPENVAEAVARLDPHVVDVSSGVESERGIKNGDRVRAFVRNAKRGPGS